MVGTPDSKKRMERQGPLEPTMVATSSSVKTPESMLDDDEEYVIQEVKLKTCVVNMLLSLLEEKRAPQVAAIISHISPCCMKIPKFYFLFSINSFHTSFLGITNSNSFKKIRRK